MKAQKRKLSTKRKSTVPSVIRAEGQGALSGLRLFALETKLKKDEISPLVAIFQALDILEDIVANKNLKVNGKSVKIEWLTDLLGELLRPKMKTLFSHLPLGALVEGLIICGSSRIQAIRAVSDWLIVGETKVRDAHTLFLKHEPPEHRDQPFLFLHSSTGGYVCYEKIRGIKNKPFPNAYPKAAKAYGVLKTELLGKFSPLPKQAHNNKK